MKIPGYNIDLERAVKAINTNGYKQVVLQIPEGLKTYMSLFVDFFKEKTDANVIVSADPCFGACDVVGAEFKNMGVDFAVQIGHTEIPDLGTLSIPTLFVNAKSDLDVTKVVKKAIPSLHGKKVGVVTTAQHVHTLDEVKKILVENNFEPVIGDGDDRISVKGQILGCDFSSATSIADKVDCFLFVGSGTFHPLGLFLSTKKPVICVDLYTGEIKEKELDNLKDMVLRQRYGAIARSKDAKIFGILVSVKRGQQRIKLADEIKEKIDSKGKKSIVISLDYFSPTSIESFKEIDCFISTACPRIAIDDYMQYKIPILTPVELDILLGIKKWDEYQFDEILN